MIRIRMIKICDTSICRSLKLIFQSCLESGKVPIVWNKLNAAQVHKKGDKHILKNYRSIFFKILLFDRMFEFFIKII